MIVMQYWDSDKEELVTVTEETPLPVSGGSGGTNGLSAYQIALAHGFVGTEEEWLASLKGVQGEPGTNGTDGIDGEEGSPGKDAEPQFTTEQVDALIALLNSGDA